MRQVKERALLGESIVKMSNECVLHWRQCPKVLRSSQLQKCIAMEATAFLKQVKVCLSKSVWVFSFEMSRLLSFNSFTHQMTGEGNQHMARLWDLTDFAPVWVWNQTNSSFTTGGWGKTACVILGLGFSVYQRKFTRGGGKYGGSYF